MVTQLYTINCYLFLVNIMAYNYKVPKLSMVAIDSMLQTAIFFFFVNIMPQFSNLSRSECCATYYIFAHCALKNSLLFGYAYHAKN